VGEVAGELPLERTAILASAASRRVEGDDDVPKGTRPRHVRDLACGKRQNVSSFVLLPPLAVQTPDPAIGRDQDRELPILLFELLKEAAGEPTKGSPCCHTSRVLDLDENRPRPRRTAHGMLT